MPRIHTARLRLVALAREELQALVGPGCGDTGLPYGVVEDLVSPDVARAVRAKLQKMVLAPDTEHPWLTYWLLVRQSQHLGIGLAGFKGAPDRLGCVEIGYGLGRAYRGCGYMTEAVHALVQWAFAHPECRAVLADTDVANLASQRVLRRVGMTIAGRTSTGTVWRVRRSEWRARASPSEEETRRFT